MALIGTTAATYADWASRADDDGKIATVINLLSQTNEILDDCMAVEGNLPTGHKSTVRTSLPLAQFRAFNQGVTKGKSTTAQNTDSCGMLEVFSDIDVDLAGLNGNTAEFRMTEDLAFLEGLNQQMASYLFYGNVSTAPQAFQGLAPRYNTVQTSTNLTANNVIDFGGSGSNNTSIWLVVWGGQSVHTIFPKGKKSGLQMMDKGQEQVFDANGNPFYAYRTHFKWDMGLTVKDWRFVVRIANIDVPSLISGGAGSNNIINALVRAVRRPPAMPRRVSNVNTSGTGAGNQPVVGRPAIYCNKTVATYLDLQAMNKTNVLLKQEEWDGKPVTTFRGIPIRTCDAILNTEARVV